jgi:hypothetical protein
MEKMDREEPSSAFVSTAIDGAVVGIENEKEKEKEKGSGGSKKKVRDREKSLASNNNACVEGLDVPTERACLGFVRSHPLQITPESTFRNNGMVVEQFLLDYVIGSRKKRKQSIHVSIQRKKQRLASVSAAFAPSSSAPPASAPSSFQRPALLFSNVCPPSSTQATFQSPFQASAAFPLDSSFPSSTVSPSLLPLPPPSSPPIPFNPLLPAGLPHVLNPLQ